MIFYIYEYEDTGEVEVYRDNLMPTWQSYKHAKTRQVSGGVEIYDATTYDFVAGFYYTPTVVQRLKTKE